MYSKQWTVSVHRTGYQPLGLRRVMYGILTQEYAEILSDLGFNNEGPHTMDTIADIYDSLHQRLISLPPTL